MIVEHSCRSDGIGRRSGLKIHRWRHRAGSSPASGTRLSLDAVRVQALFFCSEWSAHAKRWVSFFVVYTQQAEPARKTHTALCGVRFYFVLSSETGIRFIT